MAKPPKTPPQSKSRPPARKSRELREEEAHPVESVEEISDEEKGLPPGAKSTWN